MMNKNICHIVQHTYPSDVRVRKEAMSLLSRGHKVSVIALREPGHAKQEVVDGVNVYRGGFQKRRSGTLRYIYEYLVFFLYSFYKLNALDLKEKFDVIHVNTLPDFLVFAAFIQKLRGRRIILDMHEIMPEFFMSKFGVEKSHPIVRLLFFLERISLKFADDVVTVNDPIKQVFQSRAIPGKPVTVVMNTVSASSVRSNGKRSHEGFNCVYHGTLTDMYGLDTAIKGFARVSNKFNDIFFHIYGDGQILPQLKQLAETLALDKSVMFHGAIPYKDMLDALAEMDLGILAIRKDIFLNLSFSNKLAEYVYLKIPVVSSNLDAVRYYFNDEHLLFFEAGNVDDLGDKIEQAYKEKTQMQKLAESAFEKSKAFDWDIMSKRYLGLIEGD